MSLTVVAGLSQQEQTELAKAEGRVERWFQVSLDAGEALAVIRDKRLYRATHDRWVDYCRERWGKDGSYCDRLVKAWEVAKTLPIGSRPSNEAQARALRAVDPEDREQVVEMARAQNEYGELTAKGIMQAAAVPVLDGDSWCTPDDVIAMARAIMGGIDLDPASNAHAQNLVQAGKWFSKEQDGLKQIWAGRVWCNPPYSKGVCAAFAERIERSWRIKEIEQAVVLVNTASATKWWHLLAGKCSALAFPDKRISFWHPELPNQGRGEGNRYDQTIFYFGANTDGFFAECRSAGSLPMVVAS